MLTLLCRYKLVGSGIGAGEILIRDDSRARTSPTTLGQIHNILVYKGTSATIPNSDSYVTLLYRSYRYYHHFYMMTHLLVILFFVFNWLEQLGCPVTSSKKEKNYSKSYAFRVIFLER